MKPGNFGITNVFNPKQKIANLFHVLLISFCIGQHKYQFVTMINDTSALSRSLGLPATYMQRLAFQQTNALQLLTSKILSSFQNVPLTPLIERLQSSSVGKEVHLSTVDATLRDFGVHWSGIPKQEQQLLLSALSRQPATQLVNTHLLLQLLKCWHGIAMKATDFAAFSEEEKSTNQTNSQQSDLLSNNALHAAIKINALYPDLIYIFEMFLNRHKEYRDQYVFKKIITMDEFTQLLKSLDIQISPVNLNKIIKEISQVSSSSGTFNTVDLPLFMAVGKELIGHSVASHPAMILVQSAPHSSDERHSFELFFQSMLLRIQQNRQVVLEALRSHASSSNQHTRESFSMALQAAGFLISRIDIDRIWAKMLDITGSNASSQWLHLDRIQEIFFAQQGTREYQSMSAVMRDDPNPPPLRKPVQDCHATRSVITDNLQFKPVSAASSTVFHRNWMAAKQHVPGRWSINQVQDLLENSTFIDTSCETDRGLTVSYPWTHANPTPTSNIKRNLVMRVHGLSQSTQKLLINAFKVGGNKPLSRSDMTSVLLDYGIHMSKVDASDLFTEVSYLARLQGMSSPTGPIFLQWLELLPNPQAMTSTNASAPQLEIIENDCWSSEPEPLQEAWTPNRSRGNSSPNTKGRFAFTSSSQPAGRLGLDSDSGPKTFRDRNVSDAYESTAQNRERNVQQPLSVFRGSLDLNEAQPALEESESTTGSIRTPRQLQVIRNLQQKRPQLVNIFKRSQLNIIRQHDRSVFCKDLVEILATPPISLQCSREDIAQLVCDMAGIPADLPIHFHTARIRFDDIIRYLDHHVDSSESASSHGLSLHDSQLRQAIKMKLTASQSFHGDRLRLLAMTPQLRLRLRKALGRGNTVSWDASPEYCSLNEFKQLLSTIDVCLTTEELNFVHRQIRSKQPNDDTASLSDYNELPTEGAGFKVGEAILYLSTLI